MPVGSDHLPATHALLAVHEVRRWCSAMQVLANVATGPDRTAKSAAEPVKVTMEDDMGGGAFPPSVSPMGTLPCGA